MDITIIQTHTLTTAYEDQLQQLISLSEAYEPFIDCSTPYFLAFEKQNPTILIGFLSFAISEYSTKTEVEVTALVSPKFRRQGIFYALFKAAKETIPSLIKSKVYMIAALPAFLTKSSICKSFAYSEYLMKLDKITAAKRSLSEFVSIQNAAVYEGFFSDEEDEFLLYKEGCEEPCAVCSLDYNHSFTSIYGVYVDKDCRRQGIGTLFLQNLIQEYFAENDLPLILNVRSTNSGAVKLYQKCGFRVESQVDFFYL